MNIFSPRSKREISWNFQKLMMINYRFEELFNLDDKGLPRRWKQGEDVKETFLLSRNKVTLQTKKGRY